MLIMGFLHIFGGLFGEDVDSFAHGAHGGVQTKESVAFRLGT